MVMQDYIEELMEDIEFLDDAGDFDGELDELVDV
jgi:hypothetical protein